jgi:hypothetical protein
MFLNRGIVDTVLKKACGFIFMVVPRFNADFSFEQSGGLNVSFILILETGVGFGLRFYTWMGNFFSMIIHVYS